MRSASAALLAALATTVPAHAGLEEAVTGVIQPGYHQFRRASEAFSDAVQGQMALAGQCDPVALRPDFQTAFDAWMAVSWLHFGPAEEEGRALAIRFWPDPKGLGAKAQRGLLLGDPANLQPGKFAAQSVAARGLTGLERLLYPASAPEADPCPLLQATAQDLARLARELDEGWAGEMGFATLLLTAGAPENTRYISATEARQALFTQLMGGLEFIADQRLGRPLGTEDKPRPERAEARASGRAIRNIVLELQGVRRLSAALLPEAVETLAALDRAISAASQLDEPGLAGVSDPGPRGRIALLQTYVRAARATALSEMAPALGVGLGFNSQDGD